MLTIYRRHLKACDHKSDGRKYRRCRCPIWVDGFLGDVEIRKSLELRDWEKAQTTIREWEAEGALTEPGATPITLAQAQEDFLRDAEARGLRQPTLKKYRVMLAQLTAFGEKEGRPFLSQFDLPALRRFRESWIDGGISALKKLERLRAFYRFAHESGWVPENLPKKLGNPKVSSPPTLPFTKDQMVSILAACPKYSGDAQRLRAFTLLLRYSGMRIGDTATCARDRLNGRRLLLYMQRTSEPVFVVLPQFVVDALDAMSPISERYFFWTGEGDRDTVAGNWRRTLRKIFKAAGVKGGTLIVFGTRSQWTCCLPASLWNRFQSCSDMAASGSRRSTIRHGFATGRRNWKPAWNAHGHRIPWFSPRRRVRQRYTANEMLSIN